MDLAISTSARRRSTPPIRRSARSQTLITRVRELTIQASSDTTSAEGRQSIAKEVRQLQRQLVQLGNTEVAGQAVFGGTKTNVTPYVVTTGDTVTYQGKHGNAVDRRRRKSDRPDSGSRQQHFYRRNHEYVRLSPGPAHRARKQ